MPANNISRLCLCFAFYAHNRSGLSNALSTCSLFEQPYLKIGGLFCNYILKSGILSDICWMNVSVLHNAEVSAYLYNI